MVGRRTLQERKQREERVFKGLEHTKNDVLCIRIKSYFCSLR